MKFQQLVHNFFSEVQEAIFGMLPLLRDKKSILFIELDLRETSGAHLNQNTSCWIFTPRIIVLLQWVWRTERSHPLIPGAPGSADENLPPVQAADMPCGLPQPSSKLMFYGSQAPQAKCSSREQC